ncbi:MAG: RNA polymerase sigma factor [Proteobacteria bacterium]|nr:RNA polymerase sigma factor [Pseudomonadota bacterium]
MKDLLAQVEPMVPALRRYARALVRDADLADDLVQDCLERVVKRWDQRRRDEDTRQWVFSIAHNLAVDCIRQQSRRGVHVAIEDIEEREMAGPATQEDRIRGNEVLRFLEALPPEQRSVILLVSVEDMSYAEAARTLGIPVGTVMSRLARGRERLSRLMDGVPVQRPEAGSPPALRRLK